VRESSHFKPSAFSAVLSLKTIVRRWEADTTQACCCPMYWNPRHPHPAPRPQYLVMPTSSFALQKHLRSGHLQSWGNLWSWRDKQASLMSLQPGFTPWAPFSSYGCKCLSLGKAPEKDPLLTGHGGLGKGGGKERGLDKYSGSFLGRYDVGTWILRNWDLNINSFKVIHAESPLENLHCVSECL
jgi:hypothetical protein